MADDGNEDRAAREKSARQPFTASIDGSEPQGAPSPQTPTGSQGPRAEPGADTYEVVVGDDDTIEQVYDHLKDFWIKRHNLEMSDEAKQALLEDYRTTFFTDENAVIREMLDRVVSENPEGQPLSFIDLGCANGTTLHYLKAKNDLDAIKFVGIEPYGDFIADFEANFPNQTIISGTADDFAEIDFSQWFDHKVTAVLFFNIFTMVPERVAAACLRKAAGLTDNILVFDYCLNVHGALPADKNWLFLYRVENGQVYFLHHFDRYLKEVGFHITGGGEVPGLDGKRGWAGFRAQPLPDE